jgi:hypothetical protein
MRIVLHRLRRATSTPRGSHVSADTSLISPAPAASTASITAALRVSTDTAAPEAASRSTTGTVRATSSPSQTGFDPGRVDSPPRSIMAAPAADISCPASIARSGASNRPPSEKLSGVTLTMPAT